MVHIALQWGQVFAGALLVHLFVAYRFVDSPYVGNSWWAFILYGAYVLAFALILEWDRIKSKDDGLLSVPQIAMVGLTVLANAFLGIISVVDVVSTTD